MDAPRWHVRMDQFASSVAGVAEAVDRITRDPGDDLIKAGTIQRFENCWELGWKLMRDYLRWAGDPVEVPSAINVIRAGFQLNLIDDGDLWVEAKNDRNLMSHVYEPKEFYAIADRVATVYLPMFEQLLARMVSERNGGN